MGNHTLGFQIALLDVLNDKGIGIGAQMRTQNIQLLPVADDGEVHGGGSAENGELHKPPQLANHVHALNNGGGMPRGLNVNVAAIAVGELPDFLAHVHLAGIPHQIRTEFLGLGQPVVLHIQGNQQLGILHAGIGNHAQTQGTGTGDNHHILVGDLGTVHAVLGAAIGLNQQRILQGHFLGHPGNHRLLGIADILGHAAVVGGLEAEDVVGLAHPVPPGLAETALAAGHNLVGGDSVSQPEAGDVFAHLHNAAEELVAGDKGGLHPGGLHLVAPEHGCAVAALQVSGANAAGLGFDDNVIRTADRGGIVRLQPIRVLAVGHQCLHGFGNCHRDYLLNKAIL